jgi:transposase-like protein
MKTQRRTIDEQYQLIMECRSSGLSDYQWCTKHAINPGTFYNWVKRLRKKACYDIPSAIGRGNYKPALKQDVVKLEVIPEHQESLIPSAGSTMLPVEETRPVIEIMTGSVSIKISNDVDPRLLSQILQTVAGTC